MQTTTDLRQMLEAVWASPQDWTLRRIAADAAEDAGDVVLAECLRWMADNRKRAFGSPSVRHVWYNIERPERSGQDPESDIPEIPFLLLEGGEARQLHWIAYRDAGHADRAFCRAWAKARESGWVP